MYNKEASMAMDTTGGVAARRMTLRETLIERKRQFEERLAEVDAALAFIDKNPEFENFHNLVGKVGF